MSHDEDREGDNGGMSELPWSPLYATAWHNLGTQRTVFEPMTDL